VTGGSGAPLAAIAVALQRERRRLGLSLTEAARRAGIAKSTLSQLEQGTGNPSVETLWALSTTLGVPFARLVEEPVVGVRLIRAGQGPRLASDRANYVATLLAPLSTLYLRPAAPGWAPTASRLSWDRGTSCPTLATYPTCSRRWWRGPRPFSCPNIPERSRGSCRKRIGELRGRRNNG